MKKRVLPILLSLCLMASMLPTALAVDTDTPSVVGMTIMGETAQVDGPALKTTIPSETSVTLDGTALVASEAVDFQVQDGYGSAQDVLYVSAAADGSATLRIRIAAGSSGDIQTASINLASDDGVTWTGSGVGFAGVTVGALANELGNRAITIPAGGMVSQADGSASAEAVLRANHDAGNVYLMLYPAGLEEYTVTYEYSGNSYTFVVPEGAALTNALVPDLIGQEFSGWKTEDGSAAPIGAPVTSNMTLYGEYTALPGDSSFDDALTALLAGDTSGLIDGALPISNVEDFESFISRATEVPAGQLVRLQNNIDLTGKNYTAISGFKGNFDGDQNTITGGTFTAVTVGNETCAGLFASLGAGQKVANLTLDGINVGSTSATYSGALVGRAGGVESGGSGQVTIQNVHVKNSTTDSSTIRGRTAGGIAGFIIWTDVKYCSVVAPVSVSGLVNAGGIVGMSYNNVTDCYTTISPSALLRSGGIVGNNLDNGAYITRCWTTDDAIFGDSDNETIVTASFEGVTALSPTSSVYEESGFSSSIWTLGRGRSNTLILDNIIYQFS